MSWCSSAVRGRVSKDDSDITSIVPSFAALVNLPLFVFQKVKASFHQLVPLRETALLRAANYDQFR
jgi:hypothetical protein